MKKLLALVMVGVLTLGISSVATPAPGVIPIDPDCTANCAPTIVLPTGTVCVLETCFQSFCIYRCFFVLPPF